MRSSSMAHNPLQRHPPAAREAIAVARNTVTMRIAPSPKGRTVLVGFVASCQPDKNASLRRSTKEFHHRLLVNLVADRRHVVAVRHRRRHGPAEIRPRARPGLPVSASCSPQTTSTGSCHRPSCSRVKIVRSARMQAASAARSLPAWLAKRRNCLFTGSVIVSGSGAISASAISRLRIGASRK